VEVGPGSPFLSKCFGPIAALHANFFNNFQINDFFFRDVDAHRGTSARKVIFFFSLIQNRKHKRSFVLGLVSHAF